MQANWVLVESAEAYSRIYHDYQTQLNQLQKSIDNDKEQNDESFNEIVENTEIYRGLALKRFHAVLKNFDIFYNDQFDFHLLFETWYTKRLY